MKVCISWKWLKELFFGIKYTHILKLTKIKLENVRLKYFWHQKLFGKHPDFFYVLKSSCLLYCSGKHNHSHSIWLNLIKETISHLRWFKQKQILIGLQASKIPLIVHCCFFKLLVLKVIFHCKWKGNCWWLIIDFCSWCLSMDSRWVECLYHFNYSCLICEMWLPK